MKYSSSWRKPYRPLTASSTATKTAAITHTGAGRRAEPEPGAGGTACAGRPTPGSGAAGGTASARRPVPGSGAVGGTASARRPVPGSGAVGVLAGRVGWPAGVTMLMLMDPELPFKPTG